MVYTCTIESPLGTLRTAAEGDALRGLWFVGQKHYPEETGSWEEQPGCPVFAPLRTWLDRYFGGENPAVDLPLAPRGTVFQRSVWELLRAIPYGATVSYGQIAARLAAENGKPSAPRAVGGAVGRNPLSLLIPCHRVTGSGGGLTGYAGGLDRKRKLLDLEQGAAGRAVSGGG